MKDIHVTSLVGYIRQTSSRYGARMQFALALLVVLTFPVLVNALTTISQGYTTDKTLSLGAIVSLKKDSADRIEAASTSNVDNLFGVVIEKESSLLSVSNGPNQVQVATSGTVPVLVSDINGAIKRGDHITASPIAGVGMKANGNVRIIGIAQNDMSAGKKETYKEKSGKEGSANLGEVSALINVAYFFKEPEKTLIPSVVQSVANALAGREVSAVPILVSAGIFLVTVIIVCSIIYSMIRSSIISVGRNPMSQGAIYRDLIQISALVLAILSVGLVAIYLVLTKL